MAVGRDINIGNGNRIAARDYYEQTSEIIENEPEWRAPPYGSGLILCPRCKRRHIADEAIACGRCGYPHREIQEAKMQAWLREARRKQAIQQLCGVGCFIAAIYSGFFVFHMVAPRLLAFGGIAALVGYVGLPAAWRCGSIGARKSK